MHIAHPTRSYLESAEADIVCVDAVSTAVLSILESAEADIVCVDAVSTAVCIYRRIRPESTQIELHDGG